MNLLYKMFFILFIVFCNHSFAMDEGFTLQQLLEMPSENFKAYKENIIKNGDRDDKIFIASVDGIRLDGRNLKNERTFNLVAPIHLNFVGIQVNDVTENDLKKFKKIFDELYTEDLKPSQPNFNCNKKSLQELLKNISASSSSSDTETDKDLENDNLENLKNNKPKDLENDNLVNSKFFSIIQTLRNNTKLVLVGTVLSIAVLSGCVYALYKNKMKIKKEDNKKENDKKEDDEEIDSLQKEENSKKDTALEA